MSDYARIMMEEQAQARSAYNFDPRDLYTQASRNFSKVETFNANSNRPSAGVAVNEDDYTDIPVGSRSDSNAVQDTPKTRAVKRYVIIDGSQRDWVKQPNPYANLVYTFGSQTTTAMSPPVYTNNQFVPTFALEQSLLPNPIPGIPNTQGWTLPAGIGGSTVDVVYKAYNSSLTRGNFIAYDTGYIIQPSGSGFGSVFTPSNVSSIRLVRAVLPQRQFLSIPIDPGTNPTDASTSQFIQSSLIGKPYSTFTTYPYLLFYLNEFFGQYIGGNEPMRRSFSVMTQKQRQQTNFQTDLGVQQYDYEPWGEEALRFQSPVTNLQRLAVTITDPIGTSFVQNDTLTTALIQATSNQMYLQCFTPGLQSFSSNELRVGDRIVFYPDTLSNIIKSPILAVLNPQKTDFVKSLQNATFPVLQLLDYVTDSNGLYVPRADVSGGARTTTYVSSYNGFLIPNFVTIDTDGQVNASYPNAIDPVTNTILEIDVLVGSNMPCLNTSLQPVYTLELETLEPDTGSIGGRIVL
jgi:hypothetical protein